MSLRSQFASLPPPLRRLLAAGLASATTTATLADGGHCEARSAALPPTIVELYTSEGCSSCPPADRWLSTLAKRPDVLPLAFHVSYWDQLGWVDRFASPAHNERQRQVQAATAGRNIYTPQVVVNGQNWRRWADGLPKPATAPTATPAPVAITLSRDGNQVSAQVQPVPGQRAPARLAGYWAVLEDGQRSAVRAGENAGEQLHHDSVVRLYQPLTAWAGNTAPSFSLTLPPAAASATRRVVLVVTDTSLTRPVQAVAMGC